MRMSEGRDAQDRSFAVHGIFQNSGLRVTQLQANASVSDVYRALFIDLLQRNSLNNLLDAGLPAFDSCPSWIPRFDLSRRRDWIHPDYIHASSAWSEREEVVACIDDKELQCKATFVDTIGYVTEDLKASLRGDEESQSLKEQLSNLMIILRYFQRFKQSIEANPGTASLSQRVVQVVFARSLSKLSLSDRRKFGTWFTMLMRHCEGCEDEMAVAECYRWVSADNDILDMHKRVCRMFVGQRLCLVTEDGRVGTASTHVRPGDRIVRVNTVAMPLVLRSVTGGKWHLVGPAFVCGLMEGEEDWRGDDELDTAVVKDLTLV